MATVVASDGIRLDAEVHGAGIPVVVSCGYAATRETFAPQVAPLVGAGARVVLWDYRGHGRSAAPRDPGAYSLDQVVDDLGCVLEWAAPGERGVLIGFSFGGLASLHLALRRPEQVRALVLVASGPGFKDPSAQKRWEAQLERTASLFETRGFERFLASRGATTAIGRRPDTPAAKAAARAIAGQDAEAVALFGRRVVGPASGVIDELGRIDVPALVLVGEEDEGYRRAAEVLAARLPRARKATVPGAAHVVTLEEPEAVNAELVAFLESLRS